MAKAVDWVVHGVIDDKNNRVVYHTHGLDKYGSLELELNLSVEQKVAMDILNSVGIEIAKGKKYIDGDIDETLLTCKIAFKKVKGIFGYGEMNLRVIVPDPNFKFPWEEGCQKEYINQI